MPTILQLAKCTDFRNSIFTTTEAKEILACPLGRMASFTWQAFSLPCVSADFPHVCKMNHTII